jgi:ferrous iron transport protein B
VGAWLVVHQKSRDDFFLSTIFVWFASGFGWGENGFGMVDMNASVLAKIGSVIAPLFAPLGWGDWKSAVAAFTGLVAKENVVGTFGILFGFAEVAEDGAEVWGALTANFVTPIAAYSFLIFNLLCAPCFAAMGAIRREMNSPKWFWAAIGYQCGLAYVVSLCVYQFGMMFSGSFGFGTVAALLLTIGFLYLLFRPVSKVKIGGALTARG